jgi:hypothetical protein
MMHGQKTIKPLNNRLFHRCLGYPYSCDIRSLFEVRKSKVRFQILAFTRFCLEQSYAVYNTLPAVGIDIPKAPQPLSHEYPS